MNRPSSLYVATLSSLHNFIQSPVDRRRRKGRNSTANILFPIYSFFLPSMASLPSVALTGSLKLEPELNKHPSATEKFQGINISYRRSSINTQLDANYEPVMPLEFGEALSLIKEGKQIESSYYVPLLQHCLDKVSVVETEIVHAHIIKTGTHEEFFIMSFLVNVYAKCGVMVDARKVFDNLPRRNVVVWTTLMTGYVQNSQAEVAIKIFEEMLESGSFPSNYTLSIALNACTSLNSMELGKQFHAFIIKYGMGHDLSIGNALCSLYSKFGRLRSAVQAFRETGAKDVISWTTIISACGDNGRPGMGLRLFIEMLLENVEPNDFTLSSVLSLCCSIPSLDLGMQVHSWSTKLGHESNLHITNSLAYLYLKYGSIDEAKNLFNRMEYKNLITWNAMIAGYARAMDLAKDDLSAQKNGTEALGIYLKLNHSGREPDVFTLSSILTVCSRLVALEQGEQIHAQTIKFGYLSDVVVGTSLVDMYDKCGSIESARKAFLEMSTRTLISWTSMITSFARHGQPQQALQLFEDMRLAGFRPNQITFVGVLAACSHAGMVDEALEYFEIMQKEHKIKPVMDHFGCLVDMFVRLGRLDEAFNVIKRMDVEPSEFIWLLLIAGCRNHGNAELGFYAAEQLLKLKPKNVETRVMLLNMYITAERWEDVSAVRKLMKEEKVGKLNDWSRITIKGEVHSFKTDNWLHPQNAELQTLLNELVDKAKSLGHELVDMKAIDEEEENEAAGKTFSSTVYHSEMLAVAFGLLNTANGAPIRVIKSVTLFKDCHDLMKVISLLTNREIIIKDSKRLHKFVNGQCLFADSHVLL